MDKIIKKVEDLGSDSLQVFGGKFEGGINLQQIPDEIAPCIKELMNHKIENYLEIGSASGGLIACLNNFLHFKNIVLIDDDQHPKAALRRTILKDIKHKEIVGNSQYEDIVSQVVNLNLKYDMITIDADHSYGGVKTDFINYTPLLNKGGIILFHDIHAQTVKATKLFLDYVNKTDLQFCTVGEFVFFLNSLPQVCVK